MRSHNVNERWSGRHAARSALELAVEGPGVRPSSATAAIRASRGRLAFCVGFLLAAAGVSRCPAQNVLPPQPAPPVIREMAAPAGFAPWKGLPVVGFGDNEVITEWVFAGARGLADKMAPMLGATNAQVAAEQMAQFGPLPAERIVAESYPDFVPAIDLRAMAGGKDRATFVFLAALRVDTARLVRVCVGAVGEGVWGRLWLGGVLLEHGSLARLAPGVYPLMVEASSGQQRYAWQWKGRSISPRFTAVTEEEIRDVHAWEIACRQETMDAAEAVPQKMLDGVRFNPQTLRGREGFFRVGRSANGRWWFIHPDGGAWYHLGSCGLNSGGIGGRRTGRGPVPENRVAEWLDILKGWRFNALGSWTTEEFFDQGWPYADIIDGFYVGPYVDGVPEYHRTLPDVFDPQWASNLNVRCAPICALSRTNRMMVGYFLDNERGFRETRGHGARFVAKHPTYVIGGVREDAKIVVAAEPADDEEALGLLQYCLSFGDRRPPVYRKAWQFALARHGGDHAALGKAWGVALGSDKAVQELTARGERLISDAYLDDEDAFVEAFVEQYYRVFTETIRRHDPNHLILGMRHGGTPGPAVLRAEARWADVISRNCYRAEFAVYMDSLYRGVERPVLNGEYPEVNDSFDVPNPIEPPGGCGAWERKNLRRRASLDQFFQHPGMVGYTFYKWKGRPPAFGDIRWMAEANHRAWSLAARADRLFEASAEPFHGQYFITLSDGHAEVTKLPAPDSKQEPSLRIRTGPLFLGLICRRGAWDERVYGNGIKGTIGEQKARDAGVSLRIRVRKIPGMYTLSPGEGEFDLNFSHCGGRVDGTFKGAWNGIPVSGNVMGHRHRPVPTPNL